ncbi:MAG TPA: hypothetical protein VF200_07500 [Woeseiaceae bacterium]
MNCEQASLMFEAALDDPDGAERRRVMQHLSACESCRHAFRAVAYLRAERARPVPDPSPGAVDDALRAGLAERGRRGGSPGFWGGMALGAVAASAAALALLFVFAGPAEMTVEAPAVAMALDEPKELRIAIDAPEALAAAEIQVSLRGAVDLEGFAGRRDIRWTTRLERGINELRLPVTATGEQGGQVLVVVRHGGRQKTFLVDVRVLPDTRAVERAALPSV